MTPNLFQLYRGNYESIDSAGAKSDLGMLHCVSLRRSLFFWLAAIQPVVWSI
ncbi:Uncharacterised protein [Vibrio cholerae]|nr:Uncharacterised protein [Vibrio cholerae]